MKDAHDSVPPEGRFSVLRAQREGRPAIVVVNTSLSLESKRESYPWLLSLSLPIDKPNRHGLCDQEESDRLGEVEESLLEKLKASDFRYLARITWNGNRDVFLYVSDADAVVGLIGDQMHRIGMSEVSIRRTYDPDWERLSRFAV